MVHGNGEPFFNQFRYSIGRLYGLLLRKQGNGPCQVIIQKQPRLNRFSDDILHPPDRRAGRYLLVPEQPVQRRCNISQESHYESFLALYYEENPLASLQIYGIMGTFRAAPNT